MELFFASLLFVPHVHHGVLVPPGAGVGIENTEISLYFSTSLFGVPDFCAGSSEMEGSQLDELREEASSPQHAGAGLAASSTVSCKL